MAGAPFGAHAPTALQGKVIDAVRATPILRRGTFRPHVAKWIASLRPGPVDVEREGVKFRLNLDDNPIEWGIALMPHYEGAEIQFLRDGLKAGDTMVDIGANVGIYALSLASAVGPTGKVVAVEADPVALGRVQENARLNAFPQLSVIGVAAGDREGEARFRHKQNFAHSKVAPEGTSEAGDVVVPMKPLTAILDQFGVTRIDALKIDVEGFEDQVLLPFFETAPRLLWPKRVVIEDIFIDEGADNCVKRMKALGYREAGKHRINTFLVLED